MRYPPDPPTVEEIVEWCARQVMGGARPGGLAACKAEWRLITATHNLLQLWRTALAAA